MHVFSYLTKGLLHFYIKVGMNDNRQCVCIIFTALFGVTIDNLNAHRCVGIDCMWRPTVRNGITKIYIFRWYLGLQRHDIIEDKKLFEEPEEPQEKNSEADFCL